jgi:hypothetical protein
VQAATKLIIDETRMRRVTVPPRRVTLLACRSQMSHLRRWVVLAMVGLVAAACSASGSATPPASAAPSAAAPSPSPTAAASKGPATAQFSIVGTAGLTGPVTATSIVCGQPSIDGSQIFFQGTSASGPAIVIFMRAGHVEVRVATGSGATLKLRSFEGTGVTGFDASRGGQLDTPLTETTEAGSAIGDLGALNSVSGTVDCGDQQPGSATVTVTGLSPQGTLDAALTKVHVTCTFTTASGEFVGVSGLTTTGTTPVLMFVTAGTDMIQVAVETKASASFYNGKGAGMVTLRPDGAHIEGDVTESVAAGATPHTLHVAGDATCGLTIHQ